MTLKYPATRWTDELDGQLRELCAGHTRIQISRIMGIRAWRLDVRLKALDLKPRSFPSVLSPKKAEWIAVATEKALAADVRPSDVMAGRKLKPVVRARWAAWKAMQDRYPHYSIAGIARTSGHDWTTVLHGLKRLSGVPAKALRHESYRAAAGRAR